MNHHLICTYHSLAHSIFHGGFIQRFPVSFADWLSILLDLTGGCLIIAVLWLPFTYRTVKIQLSSDQRRGPDNSVSRSLALGIPAASWIAQRQRGWLTELLKLWLCPRHSIFTVPTVYHGRRNMERGGGHLCCRH